MNCISSSSSSLLPTLFPPCNFSNNSTKSRLSPVFASSKITGSYDVNTASFEDEAPGTPVPSIGADSDKMAPKWVPLIEDSCKHIMDTARTTNAKTMGPTKKRIYCVLKSP